MDSLALQTNRKRRRRRPDKPALSAQLVLDTRIKDERGWLSWDLAVDLFPYLQKNGQAFTEETHYIAITPWTAFSSANATDQSWTILPVKVLSENDVTSSSVGPSSLHFSPSAISLRSLASHLNSLLRPRAPQRSRPSIEIRIRDVVPAVLRAVCISVSSSVHDALRDYAGYNVIGSRSNGKLQPSGNRGSQSSTWSQEDDTRLRDVIRKALRPMHVIHTGDLIQLPLPSHPVTHTPPPPAKVILCEPVAQGQIGPDTRVLLRKGKAIRKRDQARLHSKQFAEEKPDEGEETADDSFFSAAEERAHGLTSSAPESEDDGISTSQSSSSHSRSSNSEESESDDSLEDMISLHAPQIPMQASGTSSAFSIGSPLNRGGASQTGGTATPGSIFSSMTATTAQPGGRTGKLFSTRTLTRKIPDGALNPKPAEEEDDEARIFVSIRALIKLRCFAGDWVRIEPATEPSISSLGAWGLGGLESLDEPIMSARVAKIYGLPDGYGPDALQRVLPRTADRRPSLASVPNQPTLVAHASPLLLSNMQSPSHVRITPLKTLVSSLEGPSHMRSKHKSSSVKLTPPMATEVTLLKVTTPASTDRALQNAMLSSLRSHFDGKRRLVKNGDLIAIPFNDRLGRLFSPQGDGGNAVEELVNDPAFERGEAVHDGRSVQDRVAWFKVDHVSGQSQEGIAVEDPWNSMALIDASSTRMVQSGSTKVKLPALGGSHWRQLLGIRHSSPTKSIADGSRYAPPLQKRLKDLVSAATSHQALQLQIEPLVILISSSQRNIGKATAVTQVCEDLGIHSFEIDAFDILSEGGASGGDVKTEAMLKARAERALSCGPELCTLLIRHVDSLTAERIGKALSEIISNSKVLVATTTDVEKIPETVRSLFTHELEMAAPDEQERAGLLQNIISRTGVTITSDVDLRSVATKTAALVAGDLVDVVERAILARSKRLEALAETLRGQSKSNALTIKDIEVAGGLNIQGVTKADFEVAVDAARSNFADAIGAPKIPNVSWDDVGGLANVKDAVMETIQLPLERPDLFAKGMKKRSGILFYGPPGTGKTLLAKAIATEFSLNFFSVKGPELLNMYIGESEANVRRVFQRARDARPCVVFFDELDSVAPKRGNQGDSGGVMDRIVSQLLAELDGMSNSEGGGGGVFVIGATNRPDLLDAALLRPGRFDKMLYLGISDTHEKQLTILQALTRKFNIDPTLSLRTVAETLPLTYTGADLYALCSDAMLKAITRKADAVDQKIKAMPGKKITPAQFFDHYATEEDIAVVVSQRDFVAAQRELVGSVSAKEMEHYARVRKTFEGSDITRNGATRVSPETNEKRMLRRKEDFSPYPTAKGKGKIANDASSARSSPAGSDMGDESFYEPEGDDTLEYEDEDEEDGVLHTDHLVTKANGNGHVANGGPVHSKGKASAKQNDNAFEDPSQDDEIELYGSG